MDGENWLDGYRTRSAELRTRAGSAARGLAGLAASASSPDGAARVTVDAAGALLHVTFGPAAGSLTRPELAEAVLAAARRARTRAAREAVATVTPVVGPDSAALRLLCEQLADPGDRRAPDPVGRP